MTSAFLSKFPPLTIALALALLFLPTMSNAAPDAWPDGSISARAFTGLPDGAPIAVEYRDDTALNNRLRPYIVNALEARGHIVWPHAAHVLFFETRIVSREYDRTGLLLRGGGSEEGVRRFDARLRTPWSTENRFRKATEHRLTLTLRKGAGPLLWEGSAVVRLRSRDWFEVQSAMATELLDLVGRTETGRPLALDRSQDSAR